MKLDDFLKVKKVRCVEGNYSHGLIRDRVYDVISTDYNKFFGKLFIKIDKNGIGTSYLSDFFEPVLDSAENPLQNMKLTPEFEAVEPITAPRFEAGQKAYCPWLNVGRLVLLESNHTDYLFAETAKGKQYFNKDGTSIDVTSPAQPDLFHATQENYELLSKLMPWVNFEQPPKPLTGSDLARAMLDKGWKYVPCYVSNTSDKNAVELDDCGVIYAVNHNGNFQDGYGETWCHVVPFDPRTGEPLTESILND